MIVFCGVHFMAETAKILNPERSWCCCRISKAGCSLSDRCPPGRSGPSWTSIPAHFVVSYINCSAAVKAMSDVICTSSNAVKIVEQIPKDRPIVFAPDQHLGRYVDEADRPGHGAVAGQLHRPRDLQREEDHAS